METQGKLMLVVAVLLIAAGIVGFYMIPESQGVLRVAAVIGGILLGAVVALVSAPGKQFISYAQASVAEARKVVWPTHQDATKLTGLVFLFVFVLAVFLWMVDSSLSWFFYDILLRRG